jgi:hypothetical protein
VRWCLDRGTLRSDFQPADIAKLRRQPAATDAIRGVYSFLLHIWDPSHRFNLTETQRWDREHLGAFARWASGQLTGEPCHYYVGGEIE